MNINLICTDGDRTIAWHINPTDCEFLIDIRDGSLKIKPKDSAWVQVQWGLDVATDEQIDPTVEPWPEILRQVNEQTKACEQAREAAAQQNDAAAQGH